MRQRVGRLPLVQDAGLIATSDLFGMLQAEHDRRREEMERTDAFRQQMDEMQDMLRHSEEERQQMLATVEVLVTQMATMREKVSRLIEVNVRLAKALERDASRAG